MVQAGRVKLVEFHIGDTTAGTPGHGNTITTGGIRVTGIQVHLAGTAGGEHHVAGHKSLYRLLVTIQHIGTDTAIVCQAELGAGNQVNGDVVFQQRDVGACAGCTCKRGFHGPAGGVGRM